MPCLILLILDYTKALSGSTSFWALLKTTSPQEEIDQACKDANVVPASSLLMKDI